VANAGRPCRAGLSREPLISPCFFSVRVACRSMSDRYPHSPHHDGETGKRKAEGKSSSSDQRGKTQRTGGPAGNGSDERRPSQKSSDLSRRSGNSEEAGKRNKVCKTQHEAGRRAGRRVTLCLVSILPNNMYACHSNSPRAFHFCINIVTTYAQNTAVKSTFSCFFVTLQGICFFLLPGGTSRNQPSLFDSV
jgi:hypothetical protein